MSISKENDHQKLEAFLIEVLPKDDEIPQELVTYIISVMKGLVSEKITNTDVYDAVFPFLHDCGIEDERIDLICRTITDHITSSRNTTDYINEEDSNGDLIELKMPIRFVDYSPAPSSSSSSSSSSSGILDILESTLEVAYEKGCTENKEEFIEFMNIHITPLQAKKILLTQLGQNDHSNDISEFDYNFDVECYFEDLWYSRYSTGVIHTKSEFDCCELCQRSEMEVPLTLHHVFPKETHKRLLSIGSSENSKKHGVENTIMIYTKELLATTMKICRLCHSSIHGFFSNDELASHYFTVEKLLSDERVERHVKWASGQSTRRKR